MRRPLLALVVYAALLSGGVGNTSHAKTRHGNPVPGDQINVSASSKAVGTEPSFVLGKVLWKSWTSALDDPRPTLELAFKQRRYISAIGIRPGDLRNGASYKTTRRPERIELVWGDQRVDVKVPDAPKLHILPLPQLVSAERLELRIMRAYGPKGRGISIAQLVVYEPGDILAIRPDLRERIESVAKKLKDSRSKSERARLGRQLASFGTPAVPWLTTMTSQLDGSGLRIALDALARIDKGKARRAILEVIGEPPMRRRNVGLVVALEHDIPIPLFRLVALLVRDRRSLLSGALTPLCREKRRYALKVLRRAMANRAPAMLARTPECLQHFPSDAKELVTDMLDAKSAIVQEAGIHAYAGLAALSPDKHAAAAVAAIAKFSRHENVALRRASIAALAKAGIAPASKALLAIAMGYDRGASKLAIAALASMSPLPVDALQEVLSRGPAYDATPMIERLIQRKSEASRGLLLQAIAIASYMKWWDAAVAGFLSHGEAALVAASDWMKKYPRQSHNLMTAMEQNATATGKFLQTTLAELPKGRVFDDVRVGLIKVVRMGQHTGWVEALVKTAKDEELSYRTRVSALDGLSKATIGDAKALSAAQAAMTSPDATIADAARRTAALLGDRKAAETCVELLRKTPSTQWRVVWAETLAAFPDLDADDLLIARFRGATAEVQSRLLEVLNNGRRPDGVAYVMKIAITRDHPLRLKALSLLGYQK